jgi:beta-N-acetylhexosaminidase
MSKRDGSGVESVGQLLIIGFDGTEISPELTSLLRKIQPAGVILFARNIKSPEQTWHLLRDCQKSVSAPLFTCIDLEGGAVDRFRDVLGATPSAADVFSTGDRKLYREHGRIIGENCRALGFNVNFAPVLDLSFEASRGVMASRTVSKNPKDATVYAREFIRGLRAANVLGCGKHFPGLGEGTLDSHRALPVIAKALKKLWSEDLLPYRTLRNALPFVMVAHAAYPEVTGDKIPASLSREWISEILRKRIGYRNLIVSDDLEMGGVLAAAPIGHAAVRAISAGSDLCLVCHHEDKVSEVYEELTRAAERDRDFAKNCERSSARVMAFKRKWTRMLRPARSAPSRKKGQAMERALWEFSEQVRLQALNLEALNPAESMRNGSASA